jgi:leader peptidase (prepilin peptidase)/N-methyltransferase
VTLADLPESFLRIVALLFGLVWGSFLNVVIHRLPRGMSVVRPASHCPGCNAPIPAHRNIPVVSWLVMRGRAPCCGARVSPRYLLIELAGGVLSLAVLERFVLSLGPRASLADAAALYVAFFALVLGLVAAAFIDLEFMIVPDSISLGATLLGVATVALRGMSIVDSLVGAATGFVVVWLPFVVIYPRLRGGVGMGLGDAKLLMGAGAWLGWSGVLAVLAAGAVQGVVAWVVLAATGRGLDEPEAVKRERAELHAELETLQGEEREALEKALAEDPLGQEPPSGWGKARIAFGPFLILAWLECLFLGMERIQGWLLV